MCYDISTLPGMSGCSVFLDFEMIAINVGSYKRKYNMGRISDISFIKTLWKWREELSANPFKLSKYPCSHFKDLYNK